MIDARSDISTSRASLLSNNLRATLKVLNWNDRERIADFIDAIVADRDEVRTTADQFLEQIAAARGENRNADLQAIMEVNNALLAKRDEAESRAAVAEQSEAELVQAAKDLDATIASLRAALVVAEKHSDRLARMVASDCDCSECVAFRRERQIIAEALALSSAVDCGASVESRC